MEASTLDILLITGVPFVLIYVIWLISTRGSYHCPQCDLKLSAEDSVCPRCGNELTVRYPH
jgi:predicted amidophosphoribosyltransferase